MQVVQYQATKRKCTLPAKSRAREGCTFVRQETVAPQWATGATWQIDTIASPKNLAPELGGTDVVTSGPTIQDATPSITGDV
ncbi:hypothetical protein CHELA1G11_12432 [Hyphomicrobiales bacterium]|nr:hypothetical protein CHELA1G2_11876 [Hyphomicrobiales bacterium]CAH1664794.1 hypothetical protein CHELA1G11_12432 [Hyphomicrobiales bacterium]